MTSRRSLKKTDTQIYTKTTNRTPSNTFFFLFLGISPPFFKGHNLGCVEPENGMADVNQTNLRSQNATLSIEVSLKSQIVTSSHGGARKLPYAFTENGIAMPLSPP